MASSEETADLTSAGVASHDVEIKTHEHSSDKGSDVASVRAGDADMMKGEHSLVRNRARQNGTLAVSADGSVSDPETKSGSLVQGDDAPIEDESVDEGSGDDAGDAVDEGGDPEASMMARSSEKGMDPESALQLLDKSMEKKGHSHPPQHCEWNGFGGWSGCTKSCGGGKKSRSRTVKKKAERGGNQCTGGDVETDDCGEAPCPIDCKWASWDSWTDCSKTCGGGTKKRSREKETRAQHGGMDCDGDSKEDMECSTADCPTAAPIVTKSFAAKQAFSILVSVLVLIVSAQ